VRHQYIIVYLDLVGYSKKQETVQLDLFKSLQKEVSYILNNRTSDDNTIAIPTGDGMIIGLKDDLQDTYLEVLNFIVNIYQWETKTNEKLRVSIHVGTINIIEDINGNNNMVGDIINNTSRMLDGAQDGSLVISKEFGELYLNAKDIALEDEIAIDDTLSFKLIDEDSIIDKHGFRHFVYGVVIHKNGTQYGQKTRILNKYFTNIYSTDYPKQQNLVSSFLTKVKNCSTLTLFGIYQPSVLKIIECIDITENKTVVINIYYASDRLKNEIEYFFNETSNNLDVSKKSESQKSINKWHQNHRYKKNIKINILEYQEFYPFGFSMIDHDISQKGFIHFSNYLPQVIPEDTPYVEVEWKTKNMPPIYRFYYDYIKENILENKNILSQI
jgi:hypothetical protein